MPSTGLPCLTMVSSNLSDCFFRLKAIIFLYRGAQLWNMRNCLTNSFLCSNSCAWNALNDLAVVSEVFVVVEKTNGTTDYKEK